MRGCCCSSNTPSSAATTAAAAAGKELGGEAVRRPSRGQALSLELRREGVGARGPAGERDDEGDDGGLGIACFFRSGVRLM